MPASTPEEDSSLWTIPLTYTTQDGNFQNTSTKQWMKSSSLKIDRPTEEDKWFIFNVQQTGTQTNRHLTIIQYNYNLFSSHRSFKGLSQGYRCHMHLLQV
jgi:hypothetical protein